MEHPLHSTRKRLDMIGVSRVATRDKLISLLVASFFVQLKIQLKNHNLYVSD